MSSTAMRSQPRLPAFFRRRSTDEFRPRPYTDNDLRVIDRIIESGPKDARRIGLSLANYWSGRLGTCAGLAALNKEWGEEFYRVPEAAALDQEAADEALGANGMVIDVQTHYIANHALSYWNTVLLDAFRQSSPPWWRGLQGVEAYTMAEYLRCVFIESETSVAVLTSAPGEGDKQMLFNRELAGTRELAERFGATGRILNHAVVQPEVPEDLEQMEKWKQQYKVAGWKVYTAKIRPGEGWSDGWMLDDERTGVPFLERAREVGVRNICAHKGISDVVPTGSPRDIGPVAATFRDLNFLVYHSAYEFPKTTEDEEGPYTEETADKGVNRLIKTVKDAKIPPGSNVYPELGTTWFALIRRPREAAHVLGKLLLAFGEDNILWGTDAIWYGSPQQAIDAFRAFQIPQEYRDNYGYPELTATAKEKILGHSAAKLYGIDMVQVRTSLGKDDLAWIRPMLQAYEMAGLPTR